MGLLERLGTVGSNTDRVFKQKINQKEERGCLECVYSGDLGQLRGYLYHIYVQPPHFNHDLIIYRYYYERLRGHKPELVKT